MVVNEWGVDEGGAERFVYEWELIVVKMKFGFVLWLGLGYDKTAIRLWMISACVV